MCSSCSLFMLISRQAIRRKIETDLNKKKTPGGRVRLSKKAPPGTVLALKPSPALQIKPSTTVAEAAQLAHAAGVPLHTDAVQAVGHLPVDFAASGADLLSLSAHKFGGPVGTGALLVKRGTTLVPLVHGGGQELGVLDGVRDEDAAWRRLVVVELPDEGG